MYTLGTSRWSPLVSAELYTVNAPEDESNLYLQQILLCVGIQHFFCVVFVFFYFCFVVLFLSAPWWWLSFCFLLSCSVVYWLLGGFLVLGFEVVSYAWKYVLWHPVVVNKI